MHCSLNQTGLFAALLALAGCVTENGRLGDQIYLEPLARITVAEYIKGKTVTNLVVARDPVFKKRKTYRAVSADDLWEQIARYSNHRPSTVVFRCTDGYSPVRELSALTNQPAFIAFEDETGPDQWESLPSGQTPAPFYLVWPLNEESAKLPWPYQLEAVEIYDNSHFQKVTNVQASFARGRALFLENCISCHKVRGVGGSISVDLAYPHKVTEYWDRKFLSRLIRDPSAVRASSKMPKLGLSESDAEEIIDFIEKL